jgi:hypothetical protein
MIIAKSLEMRLKLQIASSKQRLQWKTLVQPPQSAGRYNRLLGMGSIPLVILGYFPYFRKYSFSIHA